MDNTPAPPSPFDTQRLPRRHRQAGERSGACRWRYNVADCFKFRHKIDLDVAVEALREGWRDKKFTLEQLAASARLCRVRRVIQPYLEMLT